MPYRRLVRYENESGDERTPMVDALHDLGAEVLAILERRPCWDAPAEWHTHTRLERTPLSRPAMLIGERRWIPITKPKPKSNPTSI